eukprot:1289658-Ditylum_brightwellii.AAC.1
MDVPPSSEAQRDNAHKKERMQGSIKERRRTIPGTKFGTNLSLDKMMICFSGRSTDTHRTKNKSIREVSKKFILATTQGFVVTFTPGKRTAAKRGTQKYDAEKSQGTIEAMILHVTQ